MSNTLFFKVIYDTGAHFCQFVNNAPTEKYITWSAIIPNVFTNLAQIIFQDSDLLTKLKSFSLTSPVPKRYYEATYHTILLIWKRNKDNIKKEAEY